MRTPARIAARLALAAALASALPAAAFGDFEPGAGAGLGRGDRHRGPPPFERVLEKHADELGLDDATRERIRAIAEASREEGRPLREELDARHAELRKLLEQDAPDEAGVMRQAERIGALETDLSKHRLRTLLQIRALLTPEQRRELVEIHRQMRDERRSRWRERRRDAPKEP